MSGRRLKNFDAYRQRIELFIKASNLTVYYKELGTDAEYVPTLRRINIDPDLSNSDEVAALLHEVGHQQDDTLLKKGYYLKLSKAYGAVYSEKGTPNQLALVVECEERAWKFAEGIAKVLKIPLGAWFYQYRSLCLKDYKKVT